LIRQHTRIQPSTQKSRSDRHSHQRPDLIQAKLTLENQHITLVFDQNQTLPTLDLEATLRINGVDPHFGGSFDQDRPFPDYGWNVGLTFRYPLQNRQAKGRVQQSQLAIRQQMLRIKDLEESIMAEVRNSFRDVLTKLPTCTATRISGRLATKQLEAEEKKLQLGWRPFLRHCSFRMFCL